MASWIGSVQEGRDIRVVFLVFDEGLEVFEQCDREVFRWWFLVAKVVKVHASLDQDGKRKPKGARLWGQ